MSPGRKSTGRRLTCATAAAYGGACADTYHALNGRDGKQSAMSFLDVTDATHLAQPGEDAVAAVLIGAGFAPLGP